MTSSSATNGTAIRDGRELHWTSAGKGDPAVLLEAGVAASSSEWDPIFGRVAGLTRVVAYDRIGYRNSGPGDVSADAALLDLEAVLADAGAPGSLVLVGHSWGGVLGRLYTERHPERVAAVVLVDATHEGMKLMLNPVFTLLNRFACAARARSARRGTLRRSFEAGKGELGRMLLALPASARETLMAELSSPGTWEQAGREMRAVASSLRAVPTTMPGIPVVAVVGTRVAGKGEARPRAMIRAAYDAWLPTLPDGRLVEAPNSGHAVAQQDPDLLFDVISALVGELRAGTVEHSGRLLRGKRLRR